MFESSDTDAAPLVCCPPPP